MRDRIATQSRTILASCAVAALLAAWVIADPGSIHPHARIVLAYAAGCSLLLVPLHLLSARTVCRMVPRNQEVLRRKEQFGRPIDKTDLGVGEMLAGIGGAQSARIVRFALLGVLLVVALQLDWDLAWFPVQVPLALCWGLAAFVALGGVARRPLRPRGRSAFIGLVIFGIGLVVPTALVLYLALTAAIGGAAFTAGLGWFQHPLMHSRSVTDPIVSGEMGRSIGEYLQRED